jgi:hypothetical protein
MAGPEQEAAMATTPDRATTDRLRHDIDHGRAGDKVDAADPAAAPLGTDDEAAGHSPSGQRVQAAFREEANVEPKSRYDGWPLAVMVGAGAAVAAAAIYAVM